MERLGYQNFVYTISYQSKIEECNPNIIERVLPHKLSVPKGVPHEPE